MSVAHIDVPTPPKKRDNIFFLLTSTLPQCLRNRSGDQMLVYMMIIGVYMLLYILYKYICIQLYITLCAFGLYIFV